MINNATSASQKEQHNDALKKIHDEYGKKDEKTREPVKKLGKDEFFKLMVTQLKNQDPTKPYNNEEMASQMAQFTSLEQMINMNANLEKLAESQKPLHHLGASGLIGKHVTTDSSRVNHVEGKYTPFHFDLPDNASKVKVAVLNEKGESIREMEKTDLKKGKNSIDWDGRRSNNMSAASGVYTVQVRAEDEKGRPIKVQTTQRYMVNGVSFDGNETVLLAGDLKSPQRILLKAVTKIENIEEPKAKEEKKTEAGAEAATQAAEPATDHAQALVPDVEPGLAKKFTSVGNIVPKSALGASQEKPNE